MKLAAKDFMVTLAIWGIGSAPAIAEGGKISVGVQPVMIAPLWNAYSQGLFEKAGLDVDFKVFTTGPSQTAALNGGVIDVAWGAATTFYTLRSNGADVRWAVTLGDFNAADAMVVGPGSDIDEVTDLKGKSIALPFFTVVHGPLELLLKEKGVPADTVQFVNLAPPQAAAAVLSGTVDAAFAWPPFIDEVVDRGGKVLVRAADTPGGGWSWVGFAVSGDFAEKETETLAAFLKVLDQGTKDLKDNKDKIIDAVVETVGMPREAATKQFDTVTFPPVTDNVSPNAPNSMCGADSGAGIGQALAQARAFYTGTGQVTKPADYADYLAVDAMNLAFGTDCKL